MEIQPDFGDLLALFTKHGVEYAIVGGYALAFDLDKPNQIIQLGYPPVRVDILTSVSGLSWADVRAGRVTGMYGACRYTLSGESGSWQISARQAAKKIWPTLKHWAKSRWMHNVE